MVSRRTQLVILTMLGFCTPLKAQIQLIPEQDADTVAGHIRYLTEDSVLTVEQAAARAAAFSLNERAVFNLGLVNDPVWLCVPLRNAGSSNGNWVFALNFAAFDYLRVYKVQPGTITELFDYSRPQAREESYRRYRTIAFPIALEAEEEADIYLRFQAPNTSMPISILTETSHRERMADKIYLYMIVLALLLAIILFTAFPLLLSGLQMFILYPAGQLVLFLLCIYLDGITTAYLWPENPQFGRMMASQAGVAYNVILLSFARAFFALRQRAPLVDRMIIALVVLGIVFLTYSLFGFFVEELDRRFTTGSIGKEQPVAGHGARCQANRSRLAKLCLWSGAQQKATPGIGIKDRRPGDASGSYADRRDRRILWRRIGGLHCGSRAR